MALTPSRIVGPVTLGTSAADLLTVSGRAVLLKQIIVANTTGSAATARLSVTPSGGSQVDGALLPDVTVPANDLEGVRDLWQVLNVGDKLNGFASVDGLVITISGVLL